MKLLYITPSIEGAGGLQRVIAIKTNYFIENWNYEIEILVTNGGVLNLNFDFNKKIVFYQEKPKGKGLSYLNNYAKILKKYIIATNPDIVLICDNGFKGYCVPVLLSIKQPLIFESHLTKYVVLKPENPFNKSINYFKYKFYSYCISKFSKCVVLVESLKREFNTNNIVVIPNPIWFATNKKPNYNSKKVIAVGRHSYEKGFDRMLLIWQIIHSKYPDWQLEIYGDRNKELDLTSLANALGLSKAVTFFDAIPDINEKYQEASFCIMTSRFEGFGMVLIEAMESGITCVAYDCPCGPGDIIVDSKNGFLIENENQDDFIKAVSILIENKDLRETMGASAKKSNKKYEIQPIMNQWKVLFQSFKK
jgi:glycosyltransferase involved in cell wall biosynthesis